MTIAMQALKAHVKDGRLVLDEPTNLPEGAEVRVALVDGDELSDEERAQLHEALDAGIAAARAGDHTDAADFVRELLSRP
jgi:hypothetical protein